MTTYRKCILGVTLTATLIASSFAHAFDNANDKLDEGLDLHEDLRFENASTLLHELVSAKDFRKLDATEQNLALTHLIHSLLDQGKSPEAMGHINKLLRSTKSGFGMQSEQYVDSL